MSNWWAGRNEIECTVLSNGTFVATSNWDLESLYETIVIADGEDEPAEWKMYTTEKQARVGHRRIVQQLLRQIT
jgi:hypothetical protein